MAIANAWCFGKRLTTGRKTSAFPSPKASSVTKLIRARVESRRTSQASMNPGGGNINQTVPWEDLHKPTFYTLGITSFMGMRALFHPTFLVKTKLQLAAGEGAKTSIQMAKMIVREEGVRGLYKGFWISSPNLIFRQVYFTTYEIVRNRLGPGSIFYERLGPKKGEMLRNMLAGGGSSTVMQLFTVPLDVVAQRVMAHSITEGKHSGGAVPAANDAAAATVVSGGKTSITARQVIRQVYQESGLLGFYRGIGMSVMQFAPSSALWWTAYGIYSSNFLLALGRLPPDMISALTEQQRQTAAQAVAGLCTGITTVVLTNPLDVLRTRLQVEGRRGDDRTLVSEYRRLLKESGPKGLMRGMGARIAMAAPASFLVITVYEFIKRLSRKKAAEQLNEPAEEFALV